MKKMPRSNDTRHIVLGVVKSDDEDNYIESTVALSEENFRFLISMLPKIDTHNAMNNELQSIKDSFVELSMKAGLKRTDIIDMLTSAINYEQFMSDLAEFRKMPDLKVTGKIPLET